MNMKSNRASGVYGDGKVYEIHLVTRRTLQSAVRKWVVWGKVLRTAERITLECDQRHSSLFSGSILKQTRTRVCIWRHIAGVI